MTTKSEPTFGCIPISYQIRRKQKNIVRIKIVYNVISIHSCGRDEEKIPRNRNVVL